MLKIDELNKISFSIRPIPFVRRAYAVRLGHLGHVCSVRMMCTVSHYKADARLVCACLAVLLSV